MAAEHQRSMLAVQNAREMAKDLPPTPEALSGKLRELHLKEVLYGSYLTVQMIGSIDGFIRIRFTVQTNRPEPPKVEISRKGKVIYLCSAYAGEHGDHVNPGKRCTYLFRALDKYNRELDVLQAEMKVPPLEVYGLNVSRVTSASTPGKEKERKLREAFDSEVSRLRLMHQLTDSANKEVDSWNVPEDAKAWAKSQIEALGAKLRE